jgi:cytohesin
MTVVINASINLRGNPEADRALLDAAEKGNIEAVKQHLDAGADVNAQDNDIRWTPLHVAAAFGHKEIVELLIAKDADVNAKDVAGRTPLDLAKRYPGIIDLLRKHGGKTREELKAEEK